MSDHKAQALDQCRNGCKDPDVPIDALSGLCLWCLTDDLRAELREVAGAAGVERDGGCACPFEPWEELIEQCNYGRDCGGLTLGACCACLCGESEE